MQLKSDEDEHVVVTNGTGDYEIFLLLDKKYDIILNADFEIVDEEFNITTSMTETKLDLSITPANMTLSGRTLNDGVPEGYTALWFWEESDTAINSSVISDISGNYSIELSYGEYTIYGRKISGSEVLVHLGEMVIKPRENLEFDVNLTSGMKINGKAYYINSSYENKSAQTQIEFSDFGKIDTFTNENGIFEIWLPHGTYLISADISKSEYNMTMDYDFESYFEIEDHRTLYMNLTKRKIYDVELEWIEGEPALIKQNESISYNISIKNTGNMEETFDIIKNIEVDWEMTAPENITLGIWESEIFEVNIKAPSFAIVEHEQISVTAESRSEAGKVDKVELKVNITQVYEPANMSLPGDPIIASNNTLIYSILVQNMGNGRDNFTLNLSGVPEDWNATFEGEFLTMAAFAPFRFNITVVIPYTSPDKSASILLSTTSSVNLTATLEIDVELSNLLIEEVDIHVSGEEVSEGKVDRTPIPGFEALALIATLIAAAIMMRRRRSI
ncbi:MAG: hypothetical protein JSV09_09900 [Thermoplasmata archaeon]|nr:MAG: hypothetical protein JSV09_09900 [Thermoplasmata archaeon]